MRRTKKQADKNRYNAAKKKYRKKCLAAKTRSWRYFVETTPDESKMAILNKIIQNKAKNAVHTLTKADGSNTEPGLETLQLLAKTHFPAATADVQDTEYAEEIELPSDMLDGMYNWINATLTRRALKQFKAKKAPGPDGVRPRVSFVCFYAVNLSCRSAYR